MRVCCREGGSIPLRTGVISLHQWSGRIRSSPINTNRRDEDMRKKKTWCFTKTHLVKGISAFALSLLFSTGAAAECENRGNLDTRYCDDNGDLVADPPTDPAQWLDPDTLIFSYTPVEDPSVYENVFTEFMDYLEKKTGKRV